MPLTLVILAAGLGSRYGGLKQLEALGPNGETMLDYAVADALRAGFDRVVFVIRRDIETAFRRQVGDRYVSRLAVAYAFQDATDLPGARHIALSRQKPWGTGHAVWCARHQISGRFAVLNADDFYGAESFRQLATFLDPVAPAAVPARFALVGFRLANTLSEHGAVSRGVCAVRDGRFVTSITERTGIRAQDVGPGRTYSGEELVSMNCWGFTPALFPALERQLAEFIRQSGDNPSAEFYLPTAVSAMVAAGEATVEVLPTSSRWWGVTYREDKPRVMAALAELADRNAAPRMSALPPTL